MKKCEVENCCKEVRATGKRTVKNKDALRYCEMHVARLKRNGTLEAKLEIQPSTRIYKKLPLEQRFWKYVDKRGDDECWNWLADCSRSGYGGLWNSETNNNISVHRLSYKMHHGEIADGMLIMHSCDNKKCVNPKHLRQGTTKENTNEAIERGLRPRCAIPIKSGEDNPKSILTLEQAKYIKSHPKLMHIELAKMFGVSPNCIRGVRIGRTWKEA